MEIKLDLGLILAVYAVGIIFGIGYNHVVAWLERKKYLEGYVSLAVAGGVLVTVGLTAIFSWAYALLALGTFFCTGLPMAIGSIWRHVKAREYEQYLERWHWKTDPKSETHPNYEEFSWRGG